jgi:hypothetical protein
MNRVAANLPARLSSSSEEITIEPDGLQTFIDDVGLVVSSTDDEYAITKAGCGAAVRSAGRRLPASAGGHATIASAPRDVPALRRSRRQLVDGVRGLGRGSANPRAWARDVGRRRHLLGSRTRGPVPQAGGVHRGRGTDAGR